MPSSAAPVRVRRWFRFIRGSTLGFTLTLPVVGAATAAPVDAADVALVLAPAVAFHVFIYVLNDVVDLPVDRTEPRRSEFPLVAGTISRRFALAIALAAIPAGLGAAALSGAPVSALAVLVVAFACGAVYDVCGKRLAWPPVTDAVQGVAWASLLAYGAVVHGGPTSLTLWLAAYVLAFITLVNGVHGGLRDLGNDLRCGARTTAIMFGAQPRDDQGVTWPPALSRYTAALQTGVVLTACGAAAAGSGQVTTTVVIALLAGATLCLVRAAQRAGEQAALRHLGALHVLGCLLILMVVVASQLSPAGAVLLVTVFVGPIVLDRATVSALNWLLRRLRHPVPTHGRRRGLR